MRLDEQVTVTCTDNDKTMSGTVVRLQGDRADVTVGDLLITLRRSKPGIWVGTRAGMEFVVNGR